MTIQQGDSGLKTVENLWSRNDAEGFDTGWSRPDFVSGYLSMEAVLSNSDDAAEVHSRECLWP